MFPFVPALFRLIPHLPVLENIFFFFFFAEDRITHRDGKDHPAFHLLLTHHLSQTIPVLFSFLLHEIVQHKFGHSWCFSSAPSGFASSSCSSTDLKHFKNNTFISFGCAGSPWPRELFSSCHVRASPCSGVSSRGAWTLGREGFSSCGSWAPGHRFSSCGVQVLLPQGMWDLPAPGIKPVSQALAGGWFTVESPGKPRFGTLFKMSPASLSSCSFYSSALL